MARFQTLTNLVAMEMGGSIGMIKLRNFYNPLYVDPLFSHTNHHEQHEEMHEIMKMYIRVGHLSITVSLTTESPFFSSHLLIFDSSCLISCSRAQQDEVQNTMQATSRRPRNKECSSKYYGVRFRPDLSKWVAEIRVAEWKSVDKKVWLGTYVSEEGAAHAVDAARKILRCNKKQKPNFYCEQLEAYAESLPPELSLKNISDNTIFKAITEFVKGKARQYASEFVSTPIPKEIRTSTPVNNNRQPGAGGDVSPSDAAAVCQLGSITAGESLAKFNEFRAGAQLQWL